MECFCVCQDSRLVPGVAFKKTFSYAGFEMQRKKYKSPKIALLNIELELKAEKDNAEIRVDTVEVGGCSRSSCREIVLNTLNSCNKIVTYTTMVFNGNYRMV